MRFTIPKDATDTEVVALIRQAAAVQKVRKHAAPIHPGTGSGQEVHGGGGGASGKFTVERGGTRLCQHPACNTLHSRHQDDSGAHFVEDANWGVYDDGERIDQDEGFGTRREALAWLKDKHPEATVKSTPRSEVSAPPSPKGITRHKKHTFRTTGGKEVTLTDVMVSDRGIDGKDSTGKMVWFDRSEVVEKSSPAVRIAKAGFAPTVTVDHTDTDQNLVFGWANISFTKDGQQVSDLQGHTIDIDDLESAAYDFAVNFRKSGGMHKSGPWGDMVESFVATPDKMKALGIPEGTLPQGWWVGFKIPPTEFAKVKTGKWKMFSIQGKAQLEPYEEIRKHAAPIHPGTGSDQSVHGGSGETARDWVKEAERKKRERWADTLDEDLDLTDRVRDALDDTFRTPSDIARRAKAKTWQVGGILDAFDGLGGYVSTSGNKSWTKFKRYGAASVSGEMKRDPAFPIDQIIIRRDDMKRVLAAHRPSETPSQPVWLKAHPGGGWELADGHHRVAEALRRGQKTISADLDPIEDDEPLKGPFYFSKGKAQLEPYDQ